MPLRGNEFEVVISGDERPLGSSLRRAEGSLKKFSGLVSGISAGLAAGAFVAAGAALASFTRGAIGQFQEAERAVANLRQSLESVGREDLFEGIAGQVQELQRTFRYLDDDDITNAFQRLIQVGGLTRNEMNRLLPVIVDLNAKQRLAGNVNKTVAATAEDIVKGLNGQGRELKKYGIELKASNSSAQNLSIVLGELAPKVRGAGDAFANSLEGGIASTTVRVEELQEALGKRLLPMKASLIAFVLETAKGFETLYEKITGTYESAEKARKALAQIEASKKKAQDFVSDENTRGFLGIATEEQFNKYLNYYENQIDKLAGVLAEKTKPGSGFTSDDFPVLSKQLAGARAMAEALKEQRRLIQDKSKIGSRTGDDEVRSSKKEVDAIQLRIRALRDLIAAGVDVSQNSLELKGLDIRLILRDAKKNGLTQQEADALIFAKYPEFKGGLSLSSPVSILAGFELANISDTLAQFDSAGSMLSDGVERMYSRIATAGQAAGDALRAKLQEPLDTLASAMTSTLQGAFENIGAALGDILGGANPIAAFLSVISTALSQLGQALIAYGIATKLAIETLKNPLNPFVAIAAGIAAIAAGKILKSKISKPIKLAEGGITTGPRTALIGESGQEAIIPLHKLSSLFEGRTGGEMLAETRISGTDMILLIKRAEQSQGRRGGRPSGS